MTAAAVGLLMSIERINRLESVAGSASKKTAGFPVEVTSGASSELPMVQMVLPVVPAAPQTTTPEAVTKIEVVATSSSVAQPAADVKPQDASQDVTSVVGKE